MARNYAQVRCSIWADADFVALDGDAQRLYFLLLSQPKLSLCGVIDWVPERWARLCDGWTAGDVETVVGRLVVARFVLLDLDNSELAVRSFVKNDGFAARWQMVAGMWAAWEATCSETLRKALLREFPDEVWSHDKAKPPPMALAIRLAIADVMPTPSPTHTPASGPDWAAIREPLKAVSS